MILIGVKFSQIARSYCAQGVNNVKNDTFHPLILKFLKVYLFFE